VFFGKYSGPHLPQSKLDNPAQAIEYFTKDGQWEKKLDPAKVKIVLGAAVSELSVRYHPDDRKMDCRLHVRQKQRRSRCYINSRDAPEGPWTEPKVLLGSIS